MPCQVEMQGKLEPVAVGMEFGAMMNRLNVAAAQGMTFVMMEKPDGKMVGLNTAKILSFEALDDDEEYA